MGMFVVHQMLMELVITLEEMLPITMLSLEDFIGVF